MSTWEEGAKRDLDRAIEAQGLGPPWQPGYIITPKVAIDGSMLKMGPVMQRKRGDGTWQYRTMTPPEALAEERAKAR